MPGIIICVEANQIAMEHAQEECLPDGEDPVDLAAWEGGVEEESDLDILLAVADFFSQHLWQQHQVVIMHPDQVAILHILNDCLGK